jgi:hypothetical protein
VKFYNVQIPYRGGIPVIMKKGPIASIELSEDQIRELMDCKVPLMNPVDGAPFVLPTENVKKVEDPKKETDVTKTEEVSSTSVEAPEAPVTKEKTETVETPKEEVLESEAGVATIASPVVEGTAVGDPAITPVVESQPAAATTPAHHSPALDFDYTKVEGYSSMSKSKKRDIRAMYVKGIEAGKTAEEVYAEINTK